MYTHYMPNLELVSTAVRGSNDMEMLTAVSTLQTTLHEAADAVQGECEGRGSGNGINAINYELTDWQRDAPKRRLM
ncbi:hypothetical protein E2C01_026796 [Portunus trituberculatus]|uniref:Uncharacterized protein n=1 Tax=Portunus trituberculatus TaxID=210409 RepID=A0A5B7EJS0_PORTR|nr:hypothetical protein [Portunus trituberculatus]